MATNPRGVLPPDAVMPSMAKTPANDEFVNAKIQENPDGSATVDPNEEDPQKEQTEQNFYDDLSAGMDESERRKLANKLLEDVDRDKEARKKRDDQNAESLKRTGLGNDWPGNTDIDGSSEVVHPILTECSIDFAARVIRELLPSDKVVKYKLKGKPTPEKEARARRKVAHMNWQLLIESESFRPECEKLYTQLGLAGNGYLKVWKDPREKQLEFEYVPLDRIFLPYAARSFYSAERVTEAIQLTRFEFEDRQRRGLYREVDNFVSPSSEPDISKTEEASQKIEGKEPDGYNNDGLRPLYEIRVMLHLDELDPIATDDRAYPYLVTVDETMKDIVALRRNWDFEEFEESQGEKVITLNWLHEFAFIPWRGAYAIGLSHALAGLPIALTGAMRALLDSAHVNNLPTLLKLQGRPGGSNTQMVGTGMHEIDGQGVDDINKVVSHVPFNPPSQMLFQLLEWLDNKARGVVRTSMDDVTPGPANTPVGTELSRVEQGLIVFSSIFTRQHASMSRVLQSVHRINKLYLEDEEVYDTDDADAEGALDGVARREDYQGTCDMVPVSDPRVFTEQQRLARLTAVDALAAQGRPIDLRELTKRELDMLGVDEPDKLLLKQPSPTFQNQVAENVAMSLGQPVLAFPHQDHLAHLQVLFKFEEDPVFGQNPLIRPAFLPSASKHAVEHLLMWYADTADQIAKEATGIDPTEITDPSDPELVKRLDGVVAATANILHDQSKQMFEKILPLMQKMAQEAAQMQQQAMQQQAMMANPTGGAMAAASMAETQRKAQADQAKGQADQAKAQVDQAKAQTEDKKVTAGVHSKAQDTAAKVAIAQDANATKERINTQDNLTALTIAGGELENDEKSNLSTGGGIGRNPNPQPN